MEDWYLYLLTELFGTMLLIILGNGVVANIVLKNTKGNNGGWISITAGWGFAVMLGATISTALGGLAHLNPAVTFAMITNGWFRNTGGSNWLIPLFIVGQLVGAALGQVLLDLFYIKHIVISISDLKSDAVLGMHSTSPTDRNMFINLFCEFLGTVVLIFTIFGIGRWFIGAQWMKPIFVGLAVFSIGLSLGGTTGYAINPARDLAPRIVYQLLPVKGKIKADWNYSWIPVIAPIVAGIVVGGIFLI